MAEAAGRRDWRAAASKFTQSMSDKTLQFSKSINDHVDRELVADTPAHRRLQPLNFLTGRSRSFNNTEKVEWAIGAVYPVVEGRLYFTCSNQALRDKEEGLQMFTSKLPAQYYPFCADYGPVNLAVIFRFVELIDKVLQESKRKQCFRSSQNMAIRTNGAFLMAAYLIIRHDASPEQAWAPFARIEPTPFTTYRDATYAKADFPLSVLDCLHGLKKGMSLGWFSMETFNREVYEHYDHPENGDLHRVCPKFIAFKGPKDMPSKPANDDDIAHPPDMYTSHFKDQGVTAVIRLNSASTYNGNAFTKNGINHYDLYFDDCTTPGEGVIKRFFEVCEAEAGVVAVHCKAGLGRTGTLIGLWLMQKHEFTAKEAISWLRIARPGSVIGPQQHFLEVNHLRTQGQVDVVQTRQAGSFRNKLYRSISSSQSPQGSPISSAARSEELARQVSTGSNNRAATMTRQLNSSGAPSPTFGSFSVKSQFMSMPASLPSLQTAKIERSSSMDSATMVQAPGTLPPGSSGQTSSPSAHSPTNITQPKFQAPSEGMNLKRLGRFWPSSHRT